jgi:hypothetical protein
VTILVTRPDSDFVAIPRSASPARAGREPLRLAFSLGEGATVGAVSGTFRKVDRAALAATMRIPSPFVNGVGVPFRVFGSARRYEFVHPLTDEEEAAAAVAGTAHALRVDDDGHLVGLVDLVSTAGIDRALVDLIRVRLAVGRPLAVSTYGMNAHRSDGSVESLNVAALDLVDVGGLATCLVPMERPR